MKLSHLFRNSLLLIALGGSALVKPALGADKFSWDAQQGKIVTSLAFDHNGFLWAGTQDRGVWSLELNTPGTAQWRQFTTKDGLGDNDIYALAGDRQGRVWVGHLNHGVSVWNGTSWKNYDVMSGPLGERVFDIAVCPTDGDVWIATNAGLARYSVSKDSWQYFTRAEGLSSDQINAIAFDRAGNIYCGTQVDGLAIAQAADNYANWNSVRANTTMPSRSAGEGLPSNVINDVLVAHGNLEGAGAGIVYVSTIYGMAWSRDAGKTWKFIRGADWRQNVEGRTRKTVPVEVETDADLLLEDWTTCLTEDRFGVLWIGHPKKGFETRDPRSQRTTFSSPDSTLSAGNDDYVRAMLDAPGSALLIGRYGGQGNGLTSFGKLAASTRNPEVGVPQSTLGGAKTPSFPSEVTPLDAATLNAMQARLAKLSTPMEAGDGVFLGDDWRTHGDWVGRYGRQHATLSAMNGMGSSIKKIGRGYDHVLQSDDSYSVSVQNGPYTRDEMIPWINWAKTDNPRSVYSPLLGHRRQAEWNDWGNNIGLYPWHFGGPDLWVTIEVPAGMHRASLYFYNKDGQSDQNRYRDYPMELKRYTPDLKAADAAPALARARVIDFWGGVYKQFALCGPAKFYVKVHRNHSYAIIAQSVLLDRLPDPKKPNSTPATWMNKALYDAPAIEESTSNNENLQAARDLWTQLDAAAWKKGGLGVQWPMRLLALRAAAANGASPSLIANWRWKLALWNDAERAEWQETMRRAFPIE